MAAAGRTITVLSIYHTHLQGHHTNLQESTEVRSHHDYHHLCQPPWTSPAESVEDKTEHSHSVLSRNHLPKLLLRASRHFRSQSYSMRDVTCI